MEMKGREWLGAFLLGIILPGIIISGAEKILPPTNLPTMPTEPIVGETLPVLFADGTIVTMDMNQYLVSVLLGEVPTDFALHALMAQAVVARTYACKRHLEGIKHPEGAVCTDSACCQAYRPVEQYLSEGGTSAGVERIRRAVERTTGQVLVYDGKLIDATYFSCSGGRTEDALAVWGTDIPYLQAVDSPGEEQATHYTDTVQFTAEEFKKLLEIETGEPPSRWFGQVTYTDGGGVDTVVIAGKLFRGTELRGLLKLRSTAFVMMGAGNIVHITTRGFGHRVGMSQYGAEAMAVRGSTYTQILAHYYTGTEIISRN